MMPRIRILCFLFLALCPIPVLAQAIIVRSGAHDGYARLVLRLPPSATWTTQARDGGMIVTINGQEDGFDTTGVFRRIDQSYVNSVTGTRDRLDIQFACACVADVFTQAPNLLVIDVAKRQPGTTDRPTRMLTPQLDAFVGTQTLRLPGTEKGRPEPQQRLTPVKNKQAEITPVPNMTSLASLLPVAELPTDLSETDVQTLSQVQRNLAERIGSAATRGLLDPVAPRIDLPLTKNTPQIDTSIFDASDPQPEMTVDAPTRSRTNLRVTSSSDLPTDLRAANLTSPTLGIQCPATGLFDVPAWGHEGSMTEGIADLRQKLFSEFDRLDRDVALKLARLYLYSGFGAEAKQVLNIDPAIYKAHRGLVDVANIMEFGHARGSDFLTYFADCNAPVALWAILAQTPVSPSQPVNTDAALRALTAIPLHLRRFLAPELSQRLLARGDEVGAAAALRSIERTADEPNPDAALARAELDLNEGKAEQARENLADIVASNEEQSAEAIIKFVESHLADGTAIDPEVATLIESYAVEMRDDPIGAELRRTHVLALAKSDQFDAAFSALYRAKMNAGADVLADVNSRLLQLLTKEAADLTFLEYAFQAVSQQLPIGDPVLALDLAERLEKLGFAGQAETILNAEPEFQDTDRSRILKARIALALSRPREAEAQLFAVNTLEADGLRARAKNMAGEYSEAGALFAAVGEEERSVASSWLAEDWTEIATENESLLADAARLAITEIRDAPEPEGMLGRASDALAESAQARQVIRDLLNNSAVAPDGAE
ncbi:MAG: hypothetical protein AAFP16_09645 [Pseudomonadota bacterium]